MKTRKEKDSMGYIEVAADKYWGAQTQRSLENFRIGEEKMPGEIIYALALIKKAAAQANKELGVLESEKEALISHVCDEIMEGQHHKQFPLVVWQSGSGTQTNMNVNEVIANRANYSSTNNIGGRGFIHPNDHVNMSQSSNDTFPSAMHISAVIMLKENCIPGLEYLKGRLHEKSEAFTSVIKTGRTHMMDAIPLTMGQELSAYVSQLEHGISGLKNTIPHLLELALGGTAVGTGLNAPEGFDRLAVKKIAHMTGYPFITAGNKFESISANDALVSSSGALKTLAGSLMKIGNDIRFLASGPRCGIGEYELPAKEPGSSIMPGKVNPTQAEALTMVCAQVFGNDNSINIGGMNGHLQLNVFKPLMIYNFLQSARLLGDATRSFTKHCISELQPNTENMKKNLNNSLMLVTALSNHIGYDNAAVIAQKAHNERLTLKEAAIATGMVTTEEFDDYVKPERMI
ncbi:MAG: class II fumarate hydratase [Bacteroidales bacterium]